MNLFTVLDQFPEYSSEDFPTDVHIETVPAGNALEVTRIVQRKAARRCFVPPIAKWVFREFQYAERLYRGGAGRSRILGVLGFAQRLASRRASLETVSPGET